MFARIIALAAIAAAAHAAELRLGYAAMKRVLAQQEFTQDGRKYVRGDPKSRCSFAYLENPDLAADNANLLIKARFSGRSATNLFGACVGLGDSFNLEIRAIPAYRDGAIAFNDVKVSGDRSTYYSRRVCAALRDTLQKQFKYDVRTEAKRMLEQQNGVYRQQLVDFSVPAIRVTPDALVLQVDFVLALQ